MAFCHNTCKLDKIYEHDILCVQDFSNNLVMSLSLLAFDKINAALRLNAIVALSHPFEAMSGKLYMSGWS